MKKILIPLLILCCLLPGCGSQCGKPYQYTDFTLFDTVTTIVGYGRSEEEFQAQAREICAQLETYHRLFDIYHDYEGINNLKTVNDQAGAAPVQVEQPILDLLQDCQDYWLITDKRVNVAMGSVLKLWHEAREKALEDPEHGAVPDADSRTQAAEHCDLTQMELDLEKKTVFLKDPQMRLDVGAVAKGWAAEQVSRNAPSGMLISVGGNVCATGPKPDGSPWIVGIQNPEGEGYLRTVELNKGSVVTSGDYQRFFTVDGKRYHHIIDPDSLQPSEYWKSVTVICKDSGLADSLSTALFLLPQEQGQRLLDAVGGEALWVSPKGEILESPGFPK